MKVCCSTFCRKAKRWPSLALVLPCPHIWDVSRLDERDGNNTTTEATSPSEIEQSEYVASENEKAQDDTYKNEVEIVDSKENSEQPSGDEAPDATHLENESNVPRNVSNDDYASKPAAELQQPISRWNFNDEPDGSNNGSNGLALAPEPAAGTYPHSCSEEASNSDTIEVSEPSTSKLSLLPQDPGMYNYNNKNKQRDNDGAKVEPKEERKTASASVCSLLRSWGMKLESKDYAFIGWIHKAYNPEDIQQKIQIMRFQRKRGVKLQNPLAWLRIALARDYQYSSSGKGKDRAIDRALV